MITETAKACIGIQVNRKISRVAILYDAIQYNSFFVTFSTVKS